MLGRYVDVVDNGNEVFVTGTHSPVHMYVCIMYTEYNVVLPVSIASLTIAYPVISAASHGTVSPDGGITITSPGTRLTLATPTNSK